VGVASKCHNVHTKKKIPSIGSKVTYLCVYKPHFFDKNLPSKIRVRLLHGKNRTFEKKPYIQTTEPMTPVLYVVKPPVETASSRQIDSQKSEDREITNKLP
jgi:hypothetical protein